MGSWVGTSVGASVGSLLVPGVGSVGSGAGGIYSGGATTSPSVGWGGPPSLPLDLLVLASHSAYVASALYHSQSWLCSVSSPGASWNCCSSSALAPLVNVAVAMPPQGVVLVFVICKQAKIPYLIPAYAVCCQAPN